MRPVLVPKLLAAAELLFPPASAFTPGCPRRRSLLGTSPLNFVLHRVIESNFEFQLVNDLLWPFHVTRTLR